MGFFLSPTQLIRTVTSWVFKWNVTHESITTENSRRVYSVGALLVRHTKLPYLNLVSGSMIFSPKLYNWWSISFSLGSQGFSHWSLNCIFGLVINHEENNEGNTWANVLDGINESFIVFIPLSSYLIILIGRWFLVFETLGSFLLSNSLEWNED